MSGKKEQHISEMWASIVLGSTFPQDRCDYDHPKSKKICGRIDDIYWQIGKFYSELIHFSKWHVVDNGDLDGDIHMIVREMELLAFLIKDVSEALAQKKHANLTKTCFRHYGFYEGALT